MAQKLKEEFRERIILASKEEFRELGYKDASMRSIAFKAGMTVGNLYRYFKSKEDILLSITAECRKELQQLFSKSSKIEDTQEIRVYNIGYDVTGLRKEMDALAINLANLFGQYPLEFNILFSENEIKNLVILYFFELLKKVINSSYHVEDYQTSVQILAMSYAESIYQGITVIFSVKNMKKEKASTLLKIYLRGFVSILDCEINKLVNDYD